MTRSTIKAGEKLYAADICIAVRQTIKRRALRATEIQHGAGVYEDMTRDAYMLKEAARILNREAISPR